jgi:glycosyltransferase involved in cell wall biosynthesis
MENARLKMAGWLGAGDRAFFEKQRRRLEDAGLAEAAVYEGSFDRESKWRFLNSVDVLSVPTVYREPKGLFVLEALSAGVPVVQPSHGSFPELIGSTGGGLLVPPENPGALADALASLLSRPDRGRSLGREGQGGVRARHTAAAMADATLRVYREFLGTLG